MLLPWLVLLGAMVAIKANRDRRTWLILLPLAVVGLLSLWLKNATVRSSTDLDFDLVFQTLLCGMTLLWLAAPVLGRHGVLRLLVAIILLVLVTRLGILAYGKGSSTGASPSLLILLIVFEVVTLFAPIAAAWSCGWVYRPGRFLLWLLLWCVVLDAVATVVGGVLVFLISWASGVPLPDFRGALGVMVGMGLFFGLFLYALNVPYLLLGFASPFFRTRLQTCLNLRVRRSDIGAAGKGPFTPSPGPVRC